MGLRYGVYEVMGHTGNGRETFLAYLVWVEILFLVGDWQGWID